MLRSSLVSFACASFALVSVGCHHHDDGVAGTSSTFVSGANGDFTFNFNNGQLRAGERFDFQAFVNSAPANVTSWELEIGSGATLNNVFNDSTVRFIAGNAGQYMIRATDDQQRTGTYGFVVATDAANLAVSEVIQGTDDDEVEASLSASGTGDLFLAERIGDAAAPQVLARIDRNGDRSVETTLGYKIEDLSSDADGNVVAIRTAATLDAALVRFDRNLNEDVAFAAPDLGTGVSWRELVATGRDGVSYVVTDLMGGTILRLDAAGMPVNGDIASSLYPLPLAYDDIVDLAADDEGTVYVATASNVARVFSSGVGDSVFWQPTEQSEIRNIATDDRGVVYIAAQDADGGQCGSIQRINWRGGVVRRITDFDSGSTEFAARKILDPQALGVYADGGWRIYDDIVTLNPNFQRAAWILAGEPVVSVDGI